MKVLRPERANRKTKNLFYRNRFGEKVIPPEDSQRLRESAKNCKDAKEKIRYLALHAIALGHAVPSVAQIFCVDEATVYRWIERWHEEKNLADKPREGRPAELTEKDREKIKELVKENDPKKHGINAGMWDSKELQRYFLLQGRNISDEAIRRCLKSMGAHYVKAEIGYAEANEKQQERFARRFFNEMKWKPDSVVMLFQDESAVYCAPKKGYGWTFEERLVIKVPQKGGKKKLNCYGAVDPFRGEVLQMTSKEAKALGFIQFLDRKIVKRYPRKTVWMYLDNLPVHKCPEVREYLRKHPNIQLRFLPPYAPKLNPEEEWWNYQRRKLLNTKYFRSPHQLSTALGWFVRRTPRAQVRSICSLAAIEKLAR